MNYIEFTNKSLMLPKSSFIATIQAVADKNDLYTEIMTKLNFPIYFGQNWDALDDCFRDFCWIDSDNIIIIHEGIVLLSEHDLNLYLSSVVDCIAFWHNQSEIEKHKIANQRAEYGYSAPLHHVWFVFQEAERERIVNILQKWIKLRDYTFLKLL